MPSNFPYYIVGFGLGICIGHNSGLTDGKRQMYRYKIEANYKTNTISKYKKFIDYKSLNYEFNEYNEIKSKQEIKSFDSKGDSIEDSKGYSKGDSKGDSKEDSKGYSIGDNKE